MFDQDMIFRIPALLVALTIHEYAHARAAVSLGDPTPRFLGRLTLNPIPHLDPMGLIMFWLFKFGWAKPVPINPNNFRNWRQGMIITSLAGPLSNILVAFLTVFIFELSRIGGYIPSSDVVKIVGNMYTMNLFFAIFNLLPFPPLDGSKVLTVFLPSRYNHILDKLEQYGPFILLALVAFGVVGNLIQPLYQIIHTIIYTIIYVVF